MKGFYREDGPGPVVVFLHDYVLFGLLWLCSKNFRAHQRRVRIQNDWLDARAAASAAGVDPDSVPQPKELNQ